MSDSSLTKLLEDLQEAAIKAALLKLRSGEYAAADIKAALDILKHNGIQVLPTASPELGDLRQELDSLPFPVTGTDG